MSQCCCNTHYVCQYCRQRGAQQPYQALYSYVNGSVQKLYDENRKLRDALSSFIAITQSQQDGSYLIRIDENLIREAKKALE